MKKVLSVFLAALFVLAVSPAVFAETSGVTALKVNPYGGEETDFDTVSWFASGGARFLFLPADVDLTAAKVYFTATGAVTLAGAPIVSGGSAAAFTSGRHTLACGGSACSLTVLRSANVPAIFIETASGSLDYLLASKENKEPAEIRVYENGALTLDGALSSIKGRGNSTWVECPKKPFNIKFDKKTSLLGMPKAKKWSLLANYKDDTRIKTPAGLALGDLLEIPCTSESRNADLYLNGEYYGNFSVCESVEVGDSRVEIADLEKLNEKANPDVDIEALPRGGTGENGAVQDHNAAGSMKWVNLPNDPADVSGGYLLELDFGVRYDEEVSGFVSNRGQWVVIKAPEYASEAEVRYIAGLYNEAEEAICSETGYNSLGKYYTDYFDMPTLARTYLFMELQKPLDSALSSFYFYKDAGADQFVAAPVWDFDRGFYTPEGRCGCDLSSPEGWCSSSFSYCRNHGDQNDVETVLSLLFRHEDFRRLAAQEWQASALGAAPGQVEALFSDLYAQNAASRTMDLVRWKHAGEADPAAAAAAAADACYAKVSGFVHNRLGVLNGAFSGDLAMLYYNANGGTGHVYNREIALVGDTVTVLSPRVGDAYIAAPDGKRFYGWNTKADGTGSTYAEGSRIRLNGKTTTLYAMWEPPTGSHADDTESSGGLRGVWQRIAAFFQRIFAFFRRIFGAAG